MNYSVLNLQYRYKAIPAFVLGTALAVGAIGVTGISHAAPTSKSEVSPIMSLFDTNHDGSVSPKEASAQGMPAQVFKEADASHDGKLSPEELANAMATSAPAADAPVSPSTGTPKY
ncbi:MAG TPA: EF-hand domain-containing protein [Sulfuriferula sp.]|nr:EF-hand domain-containing protein [Sulfuriferula sp.]